MDEEGMNQNGSKPQGAGGQVPATSSSEVLMRDFISDWSPLHDASIHGRLLALKKLISQGNDVNLITADHVSPLHEACLGGHAACASFLLKHGAKVSHVQCVELLTSHGVNIDHNVKHLGTPLYVACENQQVDCARKLLESGANVNSGKGLESPLHAAARSCSAELVMLLIDFGADIWAKNAESKRPMELVPPGSPLGQLFLQKEGVS
ncbi:hypothetical protein ASZ78_008530 [Callipepla squamata]|uniref:Uncharacterized protein n=1 Tax=Callipepla squamata TaxID=9009 RepID=A0A226NDV8_CALSU|nr:hypothetical protein ASZ78_008530 [Callipepla squamata]